MTAKDFKIGALVWAKMRGFPPWPSLICMPHEDNPPKSRKPQHFVFFLGTHDFAWILDEFIFPHSEEMLNHAKLSKKKAYSWLDAIREVQDPHLISKFKKNIATKIKKEFFLSKKAKLVREMKIEKPFPHKKAVLNKNIKKGEGKLRRQVKCKSSVVKGIKKETPPPKKKVVLAKSIETVERVLRSHVKLEIKKEKNTPHEKSKQIKSNERKLKRPKKLGVLKKKHERKLVKKNSIKKSISKKPIKKNLKKELSLDMPLRSNRSTIVMVPPYELIEDAYQPLAPEPLTSLPAYIKTKKEVEPTQKKIGFLGLGTVGSFFVKHLLNTGHNVTVWNRDTDVYDEFVNAGANIAETPCDVVQHCDITFCCVSDSAASKQIFEGSNSVCEAVEEGFFSGRKGYVEMTNLNPYLSCEFGAKLQEKGVRYLEAPIFGTTAEIKDGTSIILTAGDEELYKQCESCFNAWAKRTLFMSCTDGYANKLSLILNMLAGTVIASLGQAIALSERCDIRLDVLHSILKCGPLSCPFILETARSMCQRDYTPKHPLKHVKKNMSLALEIGNMQNQPLQIAAAANESYSCAKADLFNEYDASIVHFCCKL